jgi:Ras association domain-containing protein 2/4
LPSKLDIKKIEWDEIDDLLQIERKNDAKMYSTLPSSLSTSMTDSQISTISLDSETSSFKTLSPDAETTSLSSSIYYSQMDTSSEKNIGEEQTGDYEDFKLEASRDFVFGANNMPKTSDATLKLNQPIDP